mgnify:CR=1 FL=1
MVALIGFAMIVAIVFLLLKGKMSPIVVLTLIPAIAALLLGFGPIEIADFIKDGIKTTTSNGILFIFSVIYFGVMSDTGMFDVIVQKLVKLAGGIMNTHSHTADCRTELFCTHAALCGASREVCAALMNAATTDACLELLDSAGLRAPVLESLLRAVQLHLDRRACGAFRVGAVLFSNQHGPLGATDTAAQLLNEWKEH